MNADLKAKWIAALRSGEYRQGLCALRSNSTKNANYCCLGVLCEVAGVPFRVDDAARAMVYKFDNGAESTGTLQGHLSHMVPDQSLLIEMNDSHGASFARIADYIEQHVPVD